MCRLDELSLHMSCMIFSTLHHRWQHIIRKGPKHRLFATCILITSILLILLFGYNLIFTTSASLPLRQDTVPITFIGVSDRHLFGQKFLRCGKKQFYDMSSRDLVCQTTNLPTPYVSITHGVYATQLWNPATFPSIEWFTNNRKYLQRPTAQRNVLWMPESTINTDLPTKEQARQLNLHLSMSYRNDSDIYYPYLGTDIVKTWTTPPPKRTPLTSSDIANQAQIAWLGTNCGASSHREKLVAALSSYIPVDRFGKCMHNKGSTRLNRRDEPSVLPKYRFYLSFENSNCKGYITEKLERAFLYGLVPIVDGPRRSDYLPFIPNADAIIHVDDFPSIRHLAEYIQVLLQNETLYMTKHLGYRTNRALITNTNIASTYNIHFKQPWYPTEDEDGPLCQVCKLGWNIKMGYPDPLWHNTDILNKTQQIREMAGYPDTSCLIAKWQHLVT